MALLLQLISLLLLPFRRRSSHLPTPVKRTMVALHLHNASESSNLDRAFDEAFRVRLGGHWDSTFRRPHELVS